MDITTIIPIILTLLLIIGVGYFARRYNILSQESVQGISKFVLYVSLPALILVSSTSQKYNQSEIDLFCLLVVASAIYYLISIIISLSIPRLIRSKQSDAGIYRFILVFPSAVFFAFPLIELLFGKSSIFYAAIFNLPYFILTFSLGIWLMVSPLKNDVHVKLSPRRIFLNFAFLATLIGLLMYFTSTIIPQPLFNTLDLLGKMATPLALIVTGAYLFEVEIIPLLRNARHYCIAIARLLLLPLLVFTVLKYIPDVMGFSSMPNIVLAIAVIIASMPAAVQTVIIAAEYNANPKTASEIILVTTLLAAITIPIVLFITGISQ